MSNEFLNPKSMVTPGAAGGVLVFLVNAICYSFPEIEPRYCALALSFVLGTLVFKATGLKVIEKSAYWVVNSLIIFAMGMGTANLASSVPEQLVASNVEEIGSVINLFVPAAHADPTDTTDNNLTELEKLKIENEKLKLLIEDANKQPSPSDDKVMEGDKAEEPRFFKNW